MQFSFKGKLPDGGRLGWVFCLFAFTEIEDKHLQLKSVKAII